MRENVITNLSDSFDSIRGNRSFKYPFEVDSQLNDYGLDDNHFRETLSDFSFSEAVNVIPNQPLQILQYEDYSVMPVNNPSSQEETSKSITPQSVSASVTANNKEQDDVTGMNNLAFSVGSDIAGKYQQSADVAKEWISELYSWNGDGKPPEDFFRDSNNKFATLNLGSNTRENGYKGINFDWGDGSILNDDNLLNDSFAVRSYTQASFEKGKKYKAKVRADDGYQLFAKNVNTNEWVYFTPKNEWKTDAYGAHKEIEFEVDESGVYDFHFHYFEGGGNAYFDLSWEEVNSYNYMPELASLSEPQWDEYSSDNTKFDDRGNDESPDSIKNIYADISQIIFGKDVPMSAGYAYDVSYTDGVVIENTTGWSHSGIDLDNNASDEVKAAVNGKIAKINNEGSSLGYAIAVDETDSSGKEVGRRWWYFHLNSGGNWQEGDLVEAEVSNFGTTLANQGHLHLTVQNDKFDEKGHFNSLNPDIVTDRTMSPLQAFWLSNNQNVDSGGSGDNLNIPSTLPAKQAVSNGGIIDSTVQGSFVENILDGVKEDIIREDVGLFLISIAATESGGGNWDANNQLGYLGAFQMGSNERNKFAPGVSDEEFLANKDIQMKAAQGLYEEKLAIIDSWNNSGQLQYWTTEPEKQPLTEHFKGKSDIYKAAYFWLAPAGADGNNVYSKDYARAADETAQIISEKLALSL